MEIVRRKSGQITVGNVKVGGDAPVSIQSMCNTKTCDVKATLKQIHDLEKEGCEIVRVSVPDKESALALKEIKRQISIPLVADIHFDYRLALMSAPYIDKIRINPGNIGDKDRIKLVVDECKKRDIPIRIGVNSGSIEKPLLKKFGRTPKAMVISAMGHVKILEDLNFHDICISIKSSDVLETIEAYKLLAKECTYPLHLGVTEAGTFTSGTVKSSIGIGSLLAQGIGDTIRVSLTEDPVEEIGIGIQILKSLGLRKGVNIVSCPTCARTEIDVIGIAKEIEKRTAHLKKDMTIAVMGCVVNGLGEASHADFGVAGGKDVGVIFKKGKTIKTVPLKTIIDELLCLISM